jgi:uncharacterized FlaG/YvyC family protein
MEKVSAVNYHLLDAGGGVRNSSSFAEQAPESEAASALPSEGNDAAAQTMKEVDLDQVVDSLQMDYNIKVELAADNAGRIFVRIMSSDGKRVLRQMPPDTLIKMHANMKNNRGFLADWLA